jgi:hypothetical protein
MSKALRTTFLIHTIVGLVLGVPLLVAPGRFLSLFDWAPIDALLDRVLGAALIALAWSSYRGWKAAGKSEVVVLLEMEAIFCVLAAIGLLRHLLIAYYPPIVWLVFAVLLIFAIAWLIFLFKKSK